MRFIEIEKFSWDADTTPLFCCICYLEVSVGDTALMMISGI